jgi:predicted DNA-binding transcriptional regulator YafY
MNRIDRLFAMLLVLQTRDLVRAEDLARRFEVSVRTVYRDMSALSEMGIPLVALPGEGYALMEGYFLPPLVFTPEEAAALMLGARLLALQARGGLPAAADSAIAKLAHVLPKASRAQVERWTEIIRFYAEHSSFDLSDRRLVDLQTAILARRAVQITYTPYQSTTTTVRVIEPVHLTYADGAWYVSAYCRLRQGQRSFRVNRIERYRVLRETFAPRGAVETVQPVIEVRVRFAPEYVRWVQERQHYAYVTDEGDAMVYQVHDLREIQTWLFGWGRAVEVLAPADLRQMLVAEARRLVELYSD